MKHKHLILPLAAVALFFASCDKDNGASTKDTSGASSYQEHDWNWDDSTKNNISILQ